MEINRKWVLGTLLFVGATAGWTGEGADSTLSRWVAMAREQHPVAKAAEETVGASRAEEKGATSWMPPQALIEARSNGQIDLSLSQMVPGFGKTASLSAVRRAGTRMATRDSAESMRTLALAVRESAWMEWMAWAKHGILREQETLAVRLSGAVRRAQAQGMATPSEAWLAQARVRQIGVDLQTALAAAQAATAMRESWTGPGPTFLVPDSASAPDWDTATLLEAMEQRPDLQSMRDGAAMNEAMARSMDVSLRPDFMVGGMAMRMTDGMPGWGVMAGFTLPFAPWARSMATSGSAAAKVRSRKILAQGQAMERMARAELASHDAKARAAWQALHDLETEIVPGLDLALEDTRARFAQGREMFAMVLQMDDMVRMTRMEAIMRRGEYELERARLLAAAGLEAFPKDGDR